MTLLKETRMVERDGALAVEELDFEEMSMSRLRDLEPPEGYYFCFSGGKDSIVAYDLVKRAGVKYDAHYNPTTIDPPEVVKFIRQKYPDVDFSVPEMSFWDCCLKHNILPTRKIRFCCEEFKEGYGMGRVIVTGVRWAESAKRKSRGMVDIIVDSGEERKAFMDDNDETLCIYNSARLDGHKISVNPIIDWSDEQVWEYIHKYNLPYPSSYDKGLPRVGCIGCPMAGKRRYKEFELYPWHKQRYLRLCQQIIDKRKTQGKPCEYPWDTAEHLFAWWMEELPDDGGLFKEDEQ